MPVKSIPVAGSSNQQTTYASSNSFSINWYNRYNEATEKEYLNPTSGTEIALFLDTGDINSVGRASFEVGGKQYQVVGDTFFEIDVNDVVTTIGTLNTATGYVGVAYNNAEILLVDGSNGWVYTIATGNFDVIDNSVSPALGFPDNPSDCTFIKGFFVVAKRDSDEFYSSAIDEAKSWDPENFAKANSTGDLIVSVRTLKNRLWVMSTYSQSIWLVQNQNGFPFSQDETIQVDFGVFNAKSTCTNNNVMFMVSKTQAGVGSVYYSTGGEPKQASDSAIDTQLSKLANPDDAEAFIFKEDGHTFYQLSYTTDNKTFVYDYNNSVITQSPSWHYRQMSQGERHIATSYIFYNNTPYILSYKDSFLYKMSPTIRSDNGIPIYRARQLPIFMSGDQKTIRLDMVQANMQSGVGLDADPNFYAPTYVQGADPLCYLSISRDGGRIFGNSAAAPIGRIGQYNARTIWRKKGRSGAKGQLVFLFEVFDPVACFFIDLTLTYVIAS